jgi:hypothetical protein
MQELARASPQAASSRYNGRNQGRRNILPISYGTAQPFPSYRAAPSCSNLRIETRKLLGRDYIAAETSIIFWRQADCIHDARGCLHQHLDVTWLFFSQSPCGCTHLAAAVRRFISRRGHTITGKIARDAISSAVRRVLVVNVLAMSMWSSWALRGAWPDCREAAKPSHALHKSGHSSPSPSRTLFAPAL